jgi:GAF domain-containing protein
VIFVANSDPAVGGENPESVRDLAENLNANGLDPKSIPLVIQYNKRDLPGARPVEDLAAEVKFRSVPEFETAATLGEGVFAAFREAVGRAVLAVAVEARVDPRAAQAQVQGKLDFFYDRVSRPPSPPAESATVVVPMPDDAEPESGEPKELLGHALDSGVRLSRLYAEVNVARRRLEAAVRSANALNQLARRLLAAETPGRVWKELYRVCRDQVPAVGTSLLLGAGPGDTPQAVELDGLTTEPLLAALGTGGGARVLTELTDPTTFSEKADPEILDAVRATAPDVRSLLVTPVSASGRFRGAVVLYRGGGHAPFHLRDTRLLSSAASLASLGLARALHERDLAAAAGAGAPGPSGLDVAQRIGRPLATLTSSVDALSALVTEIERGFRRIDKGIEREDPDDALTAVRLSLADPDLAAARESLRSITTDASDQASRISLELRMLLRPPSRSPRTPSEADPAADRA